MNIDREILNNKGKEELVRYLSEDGVNTILTEGLFSSAKAFLISQTIKHGVHLIVLNNKEDAEGCVNDLYNLMDDENIFFLPQSDNKNFRSKIKDASLKVQRTSAIGAIKDFKKGVSNRDYLVIVSYNEALDEGVLCEKELNKSTFTIKKGDNLSFDFLKELLFSLSFEKCDFVFQPGEFAIRGGIIDVFSYGDNKPFRIEFFGDEIEKIKVFEVNTQRTNKEVPSLEIFPNILDMESEKSASVYSLFPKDTVIWVSDGDTFKKGDFAFKTVYLSSILKNENIDKKIVFNTVPQPSFNKNFEILSDNIKEKREQGYEVYIMSESRSQIERLSNIFSSYSLVLTYKNFTIHEGFIDNDSKTCLYTDHQIFERYRRVSVKRSVQRSEQLTMNDINSLRDGDFVVHIDHGIGKFGGLVKNNINGRIQEAVKIVYRDNDVLFVSIHALHKISKYRSADSSSPKISKLGSAGWQKMKIQTKAKFKDMAEELIKLYSQRSVSKGFAFSADSYLQQELESSFVYEETPDQYRASIAVKQDMEKSFPMDRLVCGDVGFGKTEVAIRAAFKAVADSKQVAILVPTTILALQHYNSFCERLKNFPCNIEFLSRLKNISQTREITEKLKKGQIDIIIGTHKLLNKDIIFKDLGLLIIDEEQKFGVAAKERLRQIKLSVDTLTLSATPIPRTLQFSLLGARDLSIINTPPPNRLPIQTEIIDFNKDLIKEIISYEIERGGQIFFIHNRVEDILSVESILKNMLPEIKICTAHGQMDPKILEKKIIEYMAGDYDLLLSTTIIENGIDIPNTNTIIINQAQNFGLSDLHQLRGRVGRSNRKAFCYLIVPHIITLTDEARRRLKAIEAFSDLGSGFNIAMQDLDIRGMGNMFGAEQSGFIAEMGFETYQKILSEAFHEIKEKHLSENKGEVDDTEEFYVNDCMIDTDLELLIPDTYVNITAEKIRLYKELDSISDDDSLNRYLDGMKDRFGTIPDEVKELSYVVRLRMVAKEKGFERIVLKNDKMVAYFISNSMSPYYKTQLFANIIKYIQDKPGNRYQIKESNGKLYITVQNVRTIEGAYTVIKKM